jgi:anaerobic ribonucleoside-triphosphate reductase
METYGGPSSSVRPSGPTRECKYQTYTQNQRVCVICGTRTHYTCTCGEYTCPSYPQKSDPRACYVAHVRQSAGLLSPAPLSGRKRSREGSGEA